MKFLERIFGSESEHILKKLRPIVEEINGYEDSISALSDDALRAKTDEFKERLKKESLDDILPEAFAVVREASKRVSGERHYDVQLIGGMVLHQGSIAEMRTGEGKTLVATAPAYLNALTENGVHVITVNDYLARRDAVWMGQVYAFLGLTVSVINSGASYIYDKSIQQDSEEDKERDETGSYKIEYDFLRPCERKEAYKADITYGTNSEFGFDYLRDNLEHKKDDIRQMSHPYAIVDEIDSILIDEARTPLIISAPSGDSESLYSSFAKIADTLKEGEDYEVDEKLKAITLTDSGIEKAEKSLGVENIYTDKGIKYVHHLETAVRAKALFIRDKQYVVRDDEVVIVDEFTGRLQAGRRWSEGLHQAVEAKERVTIKQESRTFASITYQNYFRMYDKLAGMTGTAETSKEEFQSVYNLETVVIPTHRPIARIDNDDLIFQTENGKFKAVARKVKELHEKGQPVLIGTASIERNEELSSFLKKSGVPHEVLNAKNHEREGQIIADAGKKGRVTIATNMAGRGVDIKLGGALAGDEERNEIRELGGLYVLGTERHDARRIDNQLRGRSGRQGDKGETQFFVSLEDSLMRIFATGMVKSAMSRLNIAEDEPIESSMVTKALENAQTKIEGFHFDARKQVLAYDDVLNTQRSAIYQKRREVLLGGNSLIEEKLQLLVADDSELAKTLDSKKLSMGEEAFYEVCRRLMLQSIDIYWMEHLDVMEYMRRSVNLRAFGQRDPLIEYRKEALSLFRNLEDSIDEHTRKLLPNINVNAFVPQKEQIQITTQSGASSSGSLQAHAGKKIGRNEVVTITDGNETKKIKYKKAELLLKEGKWRIIEE